MNVRVVSAGIIANAKTRSAFILATVKAVFGMTGNPVTMLTNAIWNFTAAPLTGIVQILSDHTNAPVGKVIMELDMDITDV